MIQSLDNLKKFKLKLNLKEIQEVVEVAAVIEKEEIIEKANLINFKEKLKTQKIEFWDKFQLKEFLVIMLTLMLMLEKKE